MRLIIGISGASGVIYSFKLLEELKKLDHIETHLVITQAAKKTIKTEGFKLNNIITLSNYHYDNNDFTAPITSGSYKTDGMIIIPCSMKTIAGIASGYSDNLLLRAADVILKEGRKLILVPRETPLNPIHLENMLKLAKIGVTILAAMPAFYHHPRTIDDLIAYIVSKTLDLLNIRHNNLYKRWNDFIPDI